ncbi:MAG TPA: hypothetical protein VGU64_20375, partial [Terriglobales bacterium]|nr:hypothetical protein [Terriglobales bacterium]
MQNSFSVPACMAERGFVDLQRQLQQKGRKTKATRMLTRRSGICARDASWRHRHNTIGGRKYRAGRAPNGLARLHSGTLRAAIIHLLSLD